MIEGEEKREKEKERERKKEKERERERQIEKERERKRERQKEKEREINFREHFDENVSLLLFPSRPENSSHQISRRIMPALIFARILSD
jgi:hypothetical protein